MVHGHIYKIISNRTTLWNRCRFCDMESCLREQVITFCSEITEIHWNNSLTAEYIIWWSKKGINNRKCHIVAKWVPDIVGLEYHIQRKNLKTKNWISKPVFLTKAIRKKCYAMNWLYSMLQSGNVNCFFVNSLCLSFVSIVKANIFLTKW